MATKKAGAFDFDLMNSTSASEQGAEFEVQHPVNGPTGLFIRMNGAHSERVKAELRRISTRAKAARSARNDEDEGARFLASVTIGWRSADGSPVTLLGEELPFSIENAIRVYKEYPVIAEQASRFVFDVANFMKS